MPACAAAFAAMLLPPLSCPPYAAGYATPFFFATTLPPAAASCACDAERYYASLAAPRCYGFSLMPAMPRRRLLIAACYFCFAMPALRAMPLRHVAAFRRYRVLLFFAFILRRLLMPPDISPMMLMPPATPC